MEGTSINPFFVSPLVVVVSICCRRFLISSAPDTVRTFSSIQCTTSLFYSNAYNHGKLALRDRSMLGLLLMVVVFLLTAKTTATTVQ
jgi:hypothetical protein